MKQSRKIFKLFLPDSLRPAAKNVLALGGELKANFCVIKGKCAFLHSGYDDLKIPRNYDLFRRDVENEIKKFKTPLQVVVCDMNPAFLSSRLAVFLKNSILKKSRILNVQHHHAHFAAGLISNATAHGEAVGAICDGTGWGSDDRIWGFEFLAGGIKKVIRAGHLNYMPLPGADMSVKEPWRTAFSFLYQVFGKKTMSLPVPWLKEKKEKCVILARMMEKNINSPLTSSAGRLFDAVSALLGICLNAEKEAQAAVLLELEAKEAIGKEKSFYPYEISGGECFVIKSESMLQSIIKDMQAKIDKSVIAARFHNTFCRMIISGCAAIRKKTGLKRVVLAGGVFFNHIILERVVNGLANQGVTVIVPEPEFLGDTGLSLGQAVIGYVSGNSGKN